MKRFTHSGTLLGKMMMEVVREGSLIGLTETNVNLIYESVH